MFRMVNREIIKHFDRLSNSYDKFKERNYYYYAALKELYCQLIPDAKNKRILEIGCGTGALITYLKPKHGVGIDASKNMIKIAMKKNKKIKFEVMSIENIKIKERFDYILLADVIEHLPNIDEAIKNLNKISDKDSIIVLSMANVLWEPLLILAEKFGLKMPEGPHHRIRFKKFNRILNKNDFKIIQKGHRLLIPKKVPIIHHLNKFFYKIPFIRGLGLIEYYIIKKKTA